MLLVIINPHSQKQIRPILKRKILPQFSRHRKCASTLAGIAQLVERRIRNANPLILAHLSSSRLEYSSARKRRVCRI